MIEPMPTLTLDNWYCAKKHLMNAKEEIDKNNVRWILLDCPVCDEEHIICCGKINE